MPSLIYDAAVDGMAAGSLRFEIDPFAVMLVSGYVPDKGHTDLPSVTDDEVSSAGYTAGGEDVTVAIDVSADGRTDINLSGATWPASTISATGAVYYQITDGLLVCYVDFGGTVSSLAGAFTLQPSTIQIHNP